MIAAGQAVVSVSHVSKRFGATVAVDDAGMSLERGRITCLLGASGCGKSTLLRIIAGLDMPDEGEIRIAGHLLNGSGIFVPPEKRGIGLVFQDLALFPHLTAADNVAFGLKGMGVAQRRQRALALLDRFKLAGRADSWPHMLSGGQQQRVAIARALAPRPLALLLDEPFSGLDGELRARVRETVVEGLRESDVAILVVTHDPEEAMLLGDELSLMAEGRIIQTGTPEQCYRRPASTSAAALLGRVNVVPAQIESGIARCALGAFPAPDVASGPADALVRPENLKIASAGTEATVTDVRFGGSCFEIALDAGGLKLVMRLQSSPPLPGATVKVAVASDQIWVVARRQ